MHSQKYILFTENIYYNIPLKWIAIRRLRIWSWDFLPTPTFDIWSAASIDGLAPPLDCDKATQATVDSRKNEKIFCRKRLVRFLETRRERFENFVT